MRFQEPPGRAYTWEEKNQLATARRLPQQPHPDCPPRKRSQGPDGVPGQVRTASHHSQSEPGSQHFHYKMQWIHQMEYYQR